MKRPWLLLWIVAAIAIAIWIFFGNTIHAAYERRAMSLMKNDLPIGLSRADAYRRIKAHGMVAFNFNYERPSGLGSHSDEWPQPGQAIPFNSIQTPGAIQHPFVEVEFDLDSSSLFCVNKTYLKILFDQDDKISQIQNLPIQRDCSPL